MQPKIFVSQHREERDKEIWKALETYEIRPDNPELLILEDDKISIAQIRQLVKHLSTKPFGNTPKSAIILNGNNISPDAQNALLKTLEEPSGESVILIGVDAQNKLLPTVLSRCQVIDLRFKIEDLRFDLDKILNASLVERFEIVEKTDDKEKFLNELTQTYSQGLDKGEVSGELLEILLQAQIWKQSNVNVRTILEYLMLKLPLKDF